MPTGPPEPDSPFTPNEVESVADRVIREAMESGDFDDLPGTGEPIPGVGTVDDEMWWVRRWLERNRSDDDRWPESGST